MENWKSLKISRKNIFAVVFRQDYVSQRCPNTSQVCQRSLKTIFRTQIWKFCIFTLFFSIFYNSTFSSNFEAKNASFWKMVIFSSRVEFPAPVRFSCFKKYPDLFDTSPRRALKPWIHNLDEFLTFDESFQSPLWGPKSKPFQLFWS